MTPDQSQIAHLVEDVYARRFHALCAEEGQVQAFPTASPGPKPTNNTLYIRRDQRRAVVEQALPEDWTLARDIVPEGFTVFAVASILADLRRRNIAESKSDGRTTLWRRA